VIETDAAGTVTCHVNYGLLRAVFCMGVKLGLSHPNGRIYIKRAGEL
jgi:hypothetical protein